MAGKETVKLVSINIEMKKHLDVVQNFLVKEQPDIVCLQEVYEEDLRDFATTLSMDFVFGHMLSMGRHNPFDAPMMPMGLGILSRFPLHDVRRAYYEGNEEDAKQCMFNGDPQAYSHLVLCGTLQKGNSVFTIGTTHFMWTPDGQADDAQRRDLKNLLAILKEIPEIVCSGDFNAPRGQEIFDTIARSYKDNIPYYYTSSIDVNLHRLGEKLRGRSLMVDGLFSTPGYRCSNVRLQDGVSDHMAVVADVSK